MSERPNLSVTTEQVAAIIGDLTIRLDAANREITRLREELKKVKEANNANRTD